MDVDGYSHDGPIGRRARGYILTTDQSDAGHAVPGGKSGASLYLSALPIGAAGAGSAGVMWLRVDPSVRAASGASPSEACFEVRNLRCTQDVAGGALGDKCLGESCRYSNMHVIRLEVIWYAEPEALIDDSQCVYREQMVNGINSVNETAGYLVGVLTMITCNGTHQQVVSVGRCKRAKLSAHRRMEPGAMGRWRVNKSGQQPSEAGILIKCGNLQDRHPCLSSSQQPMSGMHSFARRKSCPDGSNPNMLDHSKP
eukprot:4138388-Pyramimonas_sp.AAC.1